MLSDIEIANKSKILNITKIAKKLEIKSKNLECYGKDKAKLSLNILKEKADMPDGKLILVTAITPTPLGEGKSTTTIGLVDSLSKRGIKTVGALREPSLGPVFGVKGGAAGGGYAQVNPMADLNLHFTGDIHAITTANNLISACIDNHIFQGNELHINPERVVWQRCIDLNDRALRHVQVEIGKPKAPKYRQDQFNISVASEIMAILCLATDVSDLNKRVDNLIVGYNDQELPVTVKDLGISGSVMVILKDAIKPNLVQTLENNPIIVHGGPFANIAHGCNSIIATKMALKLADYVVTEAGFGADLGAEKFLDIKCREAGLKPSAVVVVATCKALKYHGGVDAKLCQLTNVDALKKGIVNLQKHLDTLQHFGIPFVIALNVYNSDTIEELNAVRAWAGEHNFPLATSEVFAKGSEGGLELADQILKIAKQPIDLQYIYQLTDPIKTKISKIAKVVYGAQDVVYSALAEEQIAMLEKTKYRDFYICMAKTPLSITDNPKIVGAYMPFDLHIKEIRLSAGAKFLVCLTGDIMTMPGLPKEPLAKKIYLDAKYKIHNLS